MLDVTALNAAALLRRQDVLDQLYQRDGRVTSQLRALNWGAPRLRNLHVAFSETGEWWVSADSGCAEGRGAVGLVATLADIDTNRAAQFVARLLPAEAAA